MSIEKIDLELCTGCGECVRSCPVDCIRMDQAGGKAVIAYPDDCMLCARCLFTCKADAIYISPDKQAPLMVSWG